MKTSLFLKIVLAALIFWIGLFFLTGFLIAAIDSRARPTIEEQLRRALAVDTSATASALKFGGVAAAEKLASDLPDNDLVTRWIGPAATAPPRDPAAITVSKVVQIPSGPFEVRYESTVRRYFGPQREFIALVITVPIVLGFAVALGLYVARPYAWLRRAFQGVADGDFSIRLAPRVRRRKDEVAGLATDFDRMVEQLQALLNARERLLHDVSHELRSPLARLQMAVGLAQQDPERTSASLARIELEARRLNDLVNELIALARAEAGGGGLASYFDLSELLRVMAADMRYEAEDAGKTLMEDLDPEWVQGGGPMIKGDAELLRRSVENIVRNALKASPPGGVVEIVARHDPQTATCHIKVMDRGPGVPESALDAIFQPFFRIGGAGSDHGLGLGLSIARRAVAAHRGAISAQNRLGGGLVVSVTLPTESSE